MNPTTTRPSPGNTLGGGHDMSLLAGKYTTTLAGRSLDRPLLDAPADEFGLSADIGISGGLGPTSFDNATFTSATAAPLPVAPIRLGLSDSPSMSAYITTGSPGADINNSQLIWKQSANLPGPDLLKHLYGIAFPYACTPGFTQLSQGGGLLRLSSPRKQAFTPIHVPSVGVLLSLHYDVSLIHGICSKLSLPHSHPKYPRAAVLHAICAVASVYTPVVSNPHLYGTRGNARSRPPNYATGFLTVGFASR